MRRLLFVALMLFASPADAAECLASGCTLTVRVHATIVNPEEWGMSLEEWNDVTTTMSLPWKARMCCQIEGYRRDIELPYCTDDRIVEWMRRGACASLTPRNVSHKAP